MITALVGAWVISVAAGAFLFRPRPRPHVPRPASVNRSVLALSLVTVCVVIVDHPWAAFALVGGTLGVAATRQARRNQSFERQVAREIPELIELLRVCVDSGLPVRAAVECVAATSVGPFGAALAAATRAAAAGGSFADALEERVAAVSPLVRPVVSALAASERYGVALGPSLERLATESRAEERRRGEASARKVPVRLLFPLVLCVLPAFALLTVAPLVAGGLESLRLP